jgi:hypothetical protein
MLNLIRRPFRRRTSEPGPWAGTRAVLMRGDAERIERLKRLKRAEGGAA